MSLSSCSPLARRVSEESIKGWIRNYQQTGYAEGTRQHNARVRAEAAELQRWVVEERVDRFSEEVQEALFGACLLLVGVACVDLGQMIEFEKKLFEFWGRSVCRGNVHRMDLLTDLRGVVVSGV